MKMLNGVLALLMGLSGTAMACDYETPPGGGIYSVPVDPARSSIMGSLDAALGPNQAAVVNREIFSVAAQADGSLALHSCSGARWVPIYNEGRNRIIGASVSG